MTILLWLSMSMAVAVAQECTQEGRCDTHERCRVWANDEGEWCVVLIALLLVYVL